MFQICKLFILLSDPIDRSTRAMFTSECSINRSTHVVLDLKYIVLY